MLRLPPFRYHRPASLPEALSLLGGFGESAMAIAGGTDLLPNMKHRLFTPEHLVSLRGLPELRGIRVEEGDLVLGAAESLAGIAGHTLVQQIAPSLAEAAGQVAGPQLRAMGTLGGNLSLDTRCTWYNQTHFWREALGYCLKKDGTVCHVTQVGTKCVAAHSADTPPVLITLGARVCLAGADGVRELPLADFFVADGIRNTVRRPGELVVEVRLPLPPPGFRGVYRKLRQRRAIDYPLLTVAVGVLRGAHGEVEEITGVVGALGARPRILSGWEELAVGRSLTPDLLDSLAERAHRQCHPLENISVDPEWRRAMVPVQVRRALESLVGEKPPGV